MTRLTDAALHTANLATMLPQYDRSAVVPGIVHIGLGSFHRAHQALYLDDLLAADPTAAAFGLVGVNLLPGDEPLARVMSEQGGLYTVLERHPDGATTARVVGSIVNTLFAVREPEQVLAAMADPATHIVSLTITEGGYCYDAATGEVNLGDTALAYDLAHPDAPTTAFGYLAEALRRRRAAGVPAFTVMSCDNVHANGDLTKRVLTRFAAAVDPDLGRWISAHVAFPNSMVDRITPRTAEADIADAATLTGLDDRWPVPCEPFRQWVLQDRFSGPRPAFEKVGVQLVADVAPYELMKMRLLNAGHQAIAYAGSLLGYRAGWQACDDVEVKALLQRYQHHEAVHTLPRLPGTNFNNYSRTVVERFANPQISDSMERLCYQLSTTLATFVLPVVRDLLAAEHDAAAAIAVVACWARYLEGTDDAGKVLPIIDIHADDLKARAAQHGADLLALVRGNPAFAGLSDNPQFTGPYARTLSAIRTKGTRPALQELLTGASNRSRTRPDG
jgi:mannitol 2-dehydrogenase